MCISLFVCVCVRLCLAHVFLFASLQGIARVTALVWTLYFMVWAMTVAIVPSGKAAMCMSSEVTVGSV